MNDIDKIKAKIKKLLALSRSPNPNEAASALKMAQELMAEYNVGQADVSNIDIGEDTAKTATQNTPHVYETALIVRIGKAFGCTVIHHRKYDLKVWKFVGLHHRAQIAAYIGQVLIRKLKSARKEYIKSLFRVRSKHRKTQRADDFCISWIDAVTEKLPAFAGVSKEEEKAIDAYINKNHPELTDLKSINRSFGNAADCLNGQRAGEGVQFQHGVGVAPNGSLLLGGN